MPIMSIACKPGTTIAKSGFKKINQTLVALLLFLAPAVYGQDKQLTMEDAMVKNRTTLAPQNLRQLQFVYGSEDYVYLDRKEGKDVWMRGNFKMPGEQVFLDLEGLNQKLKSAGAEPVGSMPAIQFNKGKEWIM